MIDENKYYTPELSEFHEGLEFEVNTKSTGLAIVDFSKINGESLVYESEMIPVWTKCVFQLAYMNDFESPFNFRAVLDDNRIRVKYLNGDDIMSLGFKIANDEGNTYKSLKKQRGLSTGDDRILIVQHEVFQTPNEETRINTWVWWKTNRGDEITMFEGSIKNKQEFKKLLKQIHAADITKEQ